MQVNDLTGVQGGSGPVVAAVQARLGSSRLARKALQPILGRPMLEWVLRRVAACPGIDQVVLTTSEDPADQELTDLAQELGFRASQGPVDDIAGRLNRVAAATGAGVLVRVWGDCPCIDPALIELGLATLARQPADLIRIRTRTGGALVAGDPPGFPYGLNFQIYSQRLLAAVAASPDPFIREFPQDLALRPDSPFVSLLIDSPEDYGDVSLTVDYPQDLELIRGIFAALGAGGALFGYRDIAAWVRAQRGGQPDNRALPRNQEYFTKRAARETGPG